MECLPYTRPCTKHFIHIILRESSCLCNEYLLSMEIILETGDIALKNRKKPLPL